MTIEQLKAALENHNVKAFLDMIRHSEGTATPNGYRMLFGGRLFDSFCDHPNIFFSYKNKKGEVIKTSASGAYQITHTTWVVLKARLGLKDFSQESQDIAALELIREAGALLQVQGGYFVDAIKKVRSIWASLPGAGCHQPEHTLAEVEKWYEDAGGQMLEAA
jgi:lysozyme